MPLYSVPLTLKPMSPASDVQVPLCRTKWTIAIPAGAIATADNAGTRILAPRSIVTSAARPLIGLPESATAILVRLAYDDGVTMDVDPVIQVFGFDGINDAAKFAMLFNSAGTPADELTLTAAETTDATDGTDLFTAIAAANRFALLGHPYILIAIKTAATAFDGSLATARVEIKAI